MKSTGNTNPAFDSENEDIVGAMVPVSNMKNTKLSKTVSIELEDISSYKTPIFSRAAVSVHNSCKQYGNTRILKNLNMTVKTGTIYSLLGASGCGKTTLLSCIVGLKKLNSGEIYVLGSTPGSKISGVPGKRVGYMPQEIALFHEFTINEILQYYGKMYSMTPDMIKENITFLINFLNLPPGTRSIKDLSGGQQRRVSFACSMIHNPELLLLDEPTVGVDALLRKSIWEHLVKLASTGKTTVIITTHYIEEARQSNTIGLMRNGKLLVEQSPDNLIAKYETNLLEDIVMELCLKDNEQQVDDQEYDGSKPNFKDIYPLKYRELNEDSFLKSSGCPDMTKLPMRRTSFSTREDVTPSDWRKLHRASVVADLRQKPRRVEDLEDSWNRFCSLTYKNMITAFRNIPFLLFILLCPTLEVICVCLAVGGNPKGLPFAVVNEEAQALGNVTSCQHLSQPGCPLGDNYTGLLSCSLLNHIDAESLNIHYYESETKAFKDGKDSRVWGLARFSENFTKSVQERALFGPTSSMESVYGSRMHLFLDYTNKQIGIEIRKNFYYAFQKFMRNISMECDVDPLKFESPIVYDTPIYGNEDLSFREYIAPSVLLGIIFFFPIASSGLSYISEKRLGTLDRTFVAGVTTMELLCSYSVVQLIILVVQILLSFVFLFGIFQIEVTGSWALAAFIAMEVGFAGVSMGFILGLLCSAEIQAVLLAMGMFVPNLILAGVLWPVEGIHFILQYISYFLPCTLACESLRSVVSRGVGLSHPKVWPGLVSTVGWIILYWLILFLLHTYKIKK